MTPLSDIAHPRLLWPAARRERWLLLAVLAAGLLLRLQVWRWHELYPLGGDETEYFNQALALLRGEGYRELQLMRPPLYPVFLAGVFQLFDSQVQRVRLLQALISAATVYLQWLLARLALDADRRRGAAPLLAAGLVAMSYTLAANATELLTETTFLFGLTLALCLLLAAGLGTARSHWLAMTAGICIGLLALLRSVALPLLPLGAVWLVLPHLRRDGASRRRIAARAWAPATLFVVAGAAIIGPWAARNYLRYDHLIVVDTTGAENLWLDNDPAGREAVKQELYALGENRGLRQSLAMQRGLQTIAADPSRFVEKLGAEARKLAALEYWDYMRTHPAIWVPPLEVWLRLVLGDGIWLVLALTGSIGLSLLHRRLQWLFVPWVLYVVVTNLVFHVELRYRLPLYPVLAVAAAALLSGTYQPTLRTSPPRLIAAVASVAIICTLTLLNRPYLSEGRMLSMKHWSLWRGDGSAALRADAASALARVRLARDELAGCHDRGAGCPGAEALLVEAIEAKPAHPYAHVLRGGLLRDRGDEQTAHDELEYETTSLEDLQTWMVHAYGPRRASRVDLGDGLDLGDIEGFHPADDGWRWTKQQATIWLGVPRLPARLQLRLAHGRPAAAGVTTVPVAIGVAGRTLARLEVGPDWATYEVALPAELGEASAANDGAFALTVASPTFRPRQYDRAADDNRALGIKVDWAAIVPAAAP